MAVFRERNNNPKAAKEERPFVVTDAHKQYKKWAESSRWNQNNGCWSTRTFVNSYFTNSYLNFNFFIFFFKVILYCKPLTNSSNTWTASVYDLFR